ncbi:family 43 glycosylhydrolase [Mucilaginibacter sp. SP1R1]|uniref:family 43 glycosylhydrolase n=1 Tax=Mucilaginibacter sp. SP1R1 TaxID=2723091 RepID=UPI00161523FF|nr:family 43 glycosylhydrolase [Mucilaginibacter sp. SP1R1]MBB6148528.1 hypothetical protein [Mucilaginibacter sp. SP1R1]
MRRLTNLFLQIFFISCFGLLATKGYGQQQLATLPGNGNPIIPGYFADPTVKKFGDTYYIYATTDGNGGGLGPSQVWTSKDFVNWTMQDMNWPTTHNYWAPDVARGNDGKYYLYYCQPTVEIYGASAATPTGPWTSLFTDGKPVLTNLFVPGVITLDGQTFRDDDGKFYMTWGTWGIYPGYGCGVGLLNPDMRSFAKTAQIPNTTAKDFFEASYMFKRKGIYYLLYSSGFCENETYRVQYATSKKGPMEGFVYGKNNPILATSADGSVHGPGHNSVLQIGDEYYIIYHRHNNPHSGGGYHRQVCADKLVFDAEGNIEKVIPTHSGIGLLGKNTHPYPNLVYQKKVTASSFYNDDYKPEFAVDDNNGTLWKPKDNSTAPAWLQVDLGTVTTVKKVLTQFEYATWYYQYLIEYSLDGEHWQTFADKRNNHWHGSPAVDEGDAKARFIRLTITGTEYPGLYKAVWNLKVFSDGGHELVPANIHEPAAQVKYNQKGLLIDMDADALQPGTLVNEWSNKGTLGGSFKTTEKALYTDFIAGKKAIVFKGLQSLKSTFDVPLSLAGNSSYTVSFWAYTTQLKDENPLLTWTNGGEQLTGATFGYGNNRDMGAAQHFGFADMSYHNGTPETGKWHHIAITFDGTFEKIFVDGKLNSQESKMLFLQPTGNFLLGGKNNGTVNFSGALASLQVYDNALADSAVMHLYAQVKQPDVAVYLDAAKLPYGQLKSWENDGSAGGSFHPLKTAPLVTDVGGRITTRFNGKEAMVLNKSIALGNNGSYSIAVTAFTDQVQKNRVIVNLAGNEPGNKTGINYNTTSGKWHLLIKTVSNNEIKEYIDGNLQRTTKRTGSLRQIDSLYIGSAVNKGFEGAIASLILYKHVLSDNEIKDLTTTWLQNLHTPKGAVLDFKQAPKALSPQMVGLQAGHNEQDKTSDLQYYFTNDNNTASEKANAWTDNPYYIDYGLSPDKQYSYSYKIRDNFGNVTGNSVVAKASTDQSLFTMSTDDFLATKDYLLTGTQGSVWDGLIGKGDKQAATKIMAGGNKGLYMESQGTNWDGNTPYGPFLYRNVKGDFTAEVEVADVSGLGEKKVAGNNETGLMVRAANYIIKGDASEKLLQNGIFPAWNVGNMFTNYRDGDRRQANIQSAWNFNRYLQIQRCGNLFYIRTSKDNLTWVDLPGSPALRMDLDNKEVQVGLYQCTYGPKPGFGSFLNFKLIQNRQ